MAVVPHTTGGVQMAFVSRKAAAEDLGFSRQRLEKLIKAGRIVETEAGVDLEQARSVRATMLNVVRALEDTPDPPTVPLPPATDSAAPLLDFASARTAREISNARLAEIKYQEQAGRLVPVDEVKAKEFAVARKLRDRILGFPAKLQQFLPPDAMKLITDECDQLIRELQEDAARIAERGA